jgi:hypothetical protein
MMTLSVFMYSHTMVVDSKAKQGVLIIETIIQ